MTSRVDPDRIGPAMLQSGCGKRRFVAARARNAAAPGNMAS